MRTQRWAHDPQRRCWDSLEALQAFTDAAVERSAHERRCPATGTSVWEAFQAERRLLVPLPILPVPFDLVASRRVGLDGLVSFEGRQYSVPFINVRSHVEVRAGPGVVQVLAGNDIIAEHPRHTAARLVIDPAHDESTGTERVRPPTPLGRLGTRLQEIAQMPVECRPLDLYAALAEVAR